MRCRRQDDPRPRLLMSPRGKPLTQARARELAAGPGRRHRLRPLRGRRPARHRGARARGSLDRRLCAGRRRSRRHGAARGRGAADPRRARRGATAMPTRASRTACWNIRTTRGRRLFEGRDIPAGADLRATTARSRNGGARESENAHPQRAAPICCASCWPPAAGSCRAPCRSSSP